MKRPYGAEVGAYFALFDQLVSAETVLCAMIDALSHGVGSRGSAICTDPGGELPYVRENGEGLFDGLFRCRPDSDTHSDVTQTVLYSDSGCVCRWRQVLPIPEREDAFETVWREFRLRRGEKV